jgi:hypothetical protein
MRTSSKFGAAMLVLACVAASSGVWAQANTVNIKRATELREAPGEAAASRGPLAIATAVTRLGPRQGPWIEVRTAQGTSGWVHMFDVGSTVPAQGGNTATGALRGLTSFFGKGGTQAPATTTATATIGIRGLGAEDITNAQPNLEAVAQAEALRMDAARARQFGADATLVAQAVEPLPVPPPATRSNTGNAPGSTPVHQGTDR